MIIPKHSLMPLASASALIVIFAVLSASAIVWANGLRYDPASRKLLPTAMVAIEPSFEGVDISLNNQPVSQPTPLKLRNLKPDRYELKITKPGFHPWIERWQLDSGEVGIVGKDTVLIAYPPLVSQGEAPMSPVTALFDVGLDLSSAGELTDDGELVTAFAETPFQVHRFNQAYLYQLGRELRLFFVKGNQDYLLFTLDDASPAILGLDRGQWRLSVNSGERAKVIHLTVPAISELEADL